MNKDYLEEIYLQGIMDCYNNFINESIKNKIYVAGLKTKVNLMGKTAMIKANRYLNKELEARHKRYLRGEYDNNQKN